MVLCFMIHLFRSAEEQFYCYNNKNDFDGIFFFQKYTPF